MGFFDDSRGNDGRITAVGILRHAAGPQPGDGWQSHHSSPDVAQTGIGGGDERNSRSPANELRPDGEGTLGLSGVSAGTGANCESREKMTTFVMSSAVETSLIIFSDRSEIPRLRSE